MAGQRTAGSDKCVGISMDSLITAAARALAAGDALGALNYIALRDDPPALALRGIAMAQLGDLSRAKTLLRRAVSGFGPREAVARARCAVAEVEIALVSRDLNWPVKALDRAHEALARHGDRSNAAHARYLKTRYLLLIGRLDEAERLLVDLDPTPLPPASRAARTRCCRDRHAAPTDHGGARGAGAGRRRRTSGSHPAASGRGRKRWPCPRHPRSAADRTRQGATSAA